VSGKPIPPIVRALGWVSFFTDAASEMIYPLLPALLRSIGAAPVWLGAMEGLAEATSALVKWRIGPVVDRAPRKKPLILAGYALATVVRPVMALATAGWHVVLLRALDRVGKGIRGVPRDALVAGAVEESSLATAFAFHRMMDNAGSVLGPVLAFGLMRGLDLDVRSVIALAIVPGVLAVLMVVFGVREPAPASLSEAMPDAAEPNEASPSVPLPSSLKRYLAILALFTLGSSADSFLLLRAVDLGMDAAFVPLVWLALSLAKSLSNIPGGKLADRYGRKRTLVVAWALYAAFYAAAPFVTHPMAYAAIVVAYGLYYGLAEGSERAMVAERAPAPMRGRAFGAMHAVTGLAVLPANLVFGVLYQQSAVVAFATSAAVAAVAACALLLFVPDHRGAQAPGRADR
jgi:MFS family permease